jgi:hypothetical protein
MCLLPCLIASCPAGAEFRHYTADSSEFHIAYKLLKCLLPCLLAPRPAGAEFRHYTADITRTFPASGSFAAQQRDGKALS